jgi:hypothetical protein
MNRLELVKKLSSLAEVPVSEGEIFLEMFLRKISSEITYDEVVNIPQLGSFTCHRSKSGSARITITQDYESNDLTFYLNEEREIFNYEKFNLSLGKPVLPIQGKSENLNFVTNPNENIHTLESKADKLVALIEKTDLSDQDVLIGDRPVLSESDIQTSDIQDDNVFEEIVDSTIEEINEVSFSDLEESEDIEESFTNIEEAEEEENINKLFGETEEDISISTEDEVTDAKELYEKKFDIEEYTPLNLPDEVNRTEEMSIPEIESEPLIPDAGEEIIKEEELESHENYSRQ